MAAKRGPLAAGRQERQAMSGRLSYRNGNTDVRRERHVRSYQDRGGKQ